MRYLSWTECLAEKPFTHIIDVRSPAEFARDRIPGAVNLPVLYDDERAEVGRLYVQVSRFDARRLGGAMVARNVAAHLENFFSPLPEHARLLLYCWRGGQRSKAMATILHAVGWNVTLIAAGYKGYRAHVREALDRLCPQLQCRILTGLTGSGKSRLLRRMAELGAQVLDLENIGRHRGSLLGDEPDEAQPSQKFFESLLLEKIERFDLSRPVWVESESKRLGRLWLPESLWQAMLCAPVHEVHVPAAARAEFLLKEYAHFTAAPEALTEKLETLRESCSGAQVESWCDMIRAEEWRSFVLSLLERHYDPGYLRNRKFAEAQAHYDMADIDGVAFERTAAVLVTVT